MPILGRFLTSILLTVIFYSGPVLAAGQANEFPSCQQSFFHKPAAAPAGLLVIAVDRTVVFPRTVVDNTAKRILRAITYGERIVIVEFSDLGSNNYIQVMLNGTLDALPSRTQYESDLPANELGQARQCFRLLRIYVQKKVAGTLLGLLRHPLIKAKNSLILEGLTTISQQVIAPSPIANKQLVIISDMLQNSNTLSVYGSRGLRTVNSANMLTEARRAGLLASLRGVHVYVAGAAYPGRPALHETHGARQALRAFWRKWFSSSGARLELWGEPMLLEDIPSIVPKQTLSLFQ